MSRKRRHSTMEECNNNDTPSESNLDIKRKQRKLERLSAQLKSDLTEKMTEALKSPEGEPTTRFGRKVRKQFIPANDLKYKTMMECTQSQSKRKVRKIFSIHNPSANASLRLVSNHPTTVFAKSPIQKLISVTKIGLKNDQFQKQAIDNSINIELPTIDTCQHNADITKATEPTILSQHHKNGDAIDSVETTPVDFEDNLKVYHLLKNRSHQSDSLLIIDEIDLTSSTEGSEHGFDTKSQDKTEIDTFATTERSTSPVSNASQNKTNSPKIFATPAKLANLSIALTDCVRSTPIPDAIVYSDKPFSDGTSDDCVIADCDDIHSDDESTDNWQIGQIVWAALFGYPFWPAIIFNSEDEQIFRKDNQIHVKFLYDSGRRNWVNVKSSILPFKGRSEFIEKCKLPINKQHKAYRLSKTKKWELAIHEANILLCIKPEYRVKFYELILLNAVHDTDHEIRLNRRKTGDRCDTPQTFDTAYSSLKQSSSPASLSPLTELDRNYDVDKNINNYLQSVELSRPDELPEEDLQMDEIPSFTSLTESLSSTDQIYCRLVKLVYDKLRGTEIPINQNAISNEIQFIALLNEMFSQMISVKIRANTSSSSIREKRRYSVGSVATSFESSSFTEQNQTKRQRKLAEIKTRDEVAQTVRTPVVEMPQLKKQPTKDELKQKKQQAVDTFIRSCYIRNHPANFLLKGLPKGPICQCCLKSGAVIKCAGTCSAYFHKECIRNGANRTIPYNDILKRKTQTDDVASIITENTESLKCNQCLNSPIISCFICSMSDGNCMPCCDKNCGKYYHLECFKYWPQYKENYQTSNNKAGVKVNFHCPRHVCHNCISSDIRNMFHKIESDKKLMKCLLCPGTYHRSSNCIPAGSELVSESQLICARHQSTKTMKHIDYCLFCSKGGSLVLCDTCVYAFHPECLKVPVGDHFICEECESGRRPLNGEIVWCKYPLSPWWPAIIVPPPRIPEAVYDRKKGPNHICVYFFGTYNFGWVAQSQIYLYIKGDGDCKGKAEKEQLLSAIAEAEKWMQRFEEINQKNSISRSITHPPYKHIKTNKIIAKFDEAEYNECKCRPDDPAPCGIESNCYNAVLNIECDPELCPAKDKCQNQNFHRGEQFEFEVKITDSKGWGLYAKEEIPVDRFIIEYRGEVIDHVEFEQRFNRATANKEDNFYFLILGRYGKTTLYVDAKVYGNDARFINHSCDPNVAPNKWTVFSNGQEHIRIGFFALRTILPGEEITFDYNWGTKNMKTICQCGSKKCRGYI